MKTSLPDKKKILLTSFFPRHTGGLQTHIDLLERSLRLANQNVKLLIRQTPTLSSKTLTALRHPFRTLQNPRLSLLQAHLNEFSKSIADHASDAQVVHCHEVFSCVLVPSGTAQVILTVHGPASKEMAMTFPGNSKLIEFVQDIEKQAYQKADLILAVDDGQKQILREEYGVPPEKIKVIMNAVDTDEFRPGLSTQEAPYLLSHRRFVKKNGVHVALEAMTLLDPSYRLKLAGDGPEEGALRAFAESRGLADRVDFLGSQPRSQMLRLVQAAEAILVPSVPSHGVVEATSISAIEAMACGKVVIASRIGGLAQLITHGEDGLLFEAGDANELAACVRSLRSDPGQAKALGDKAREKAVNSYGARAWVQKIIKCYGF